MTRLEEEHAAAVESLKEDFRRREEAAAAKATAALKEAKRAETKMAERFRCAGAAAQTAEERVAAAELAASELRRELEQRNSTIRWLEGQVGWLQGVGGAGALCGSLAGGGLVAR